MTGNLSKIYIFHILVIISYYYRFGVLGPTTEFSQLFPVLDYDLGSVGAQLTLDQIENQAGAAASSAIGATHGSGDTTPVSISSDWEFNTNDATKGSTTNELYTEEEEEETTLSTDTCFSTQGDLLTSSIDQCDLLINNAQDQFALDNKIPQSKMPILSSVSVDVLNFDFSKNTNELTASTSAVPLGTPKIDNKFRNTTIQKQISLYEKDSLSSMEYKNLANDVPKFIETPSNLKLAKRRIGTIEVPNIISAEDLEKSMTNIEKNLNIAMSTSKDKCAKTKSCVNLKTITTASTLVPSTPPPPGSVQVRESFIEAPKRIAKSFHGKTQFSNLESMRRSSDAPHMQQQQQQPGPSKISNVNQLHRQYSNPIPGGSSLSLSSASNNLTPSSHRFKTTIVKEDNVQVVVNSANASASSSSSSQYMDEESVNDSTGALSKNLKPDVKKN